LVINTEVLLVLLQSLIRKLKNKDVEDLFFKSIQKGRKTTEKVIGAKDIVIDLRKSYHSVEEIKANLRWQRIQYFRKNNIRHNKTSKVFLAYQEEQRLVKTRTQITQNTGRQKPSAVFCPGKIQKYISRSIMFTALYKKFGISYAILQSEYPETKCIDKLNSILSFVALKASNVRRYSSDDRWCMERGLGLFAGLNVLPKAAWYTSYSHRVTSDMNLKFLKSLHKIWSENDLLSDTANLDFYDNSILGRK